MRTWTTHTLALDDTDVTITVPVNPNPDAVLAAHAGHPHHRVRLSPADVITLIRAMVDRHPLAVMAFDRMPDDVADAAIRFAFRHELIRQEGQRVSLTRYGRRYVRNYDR